YLSNGKPAGEFACGLFAAVEAGNLMRVVCRRRRNRKQRPAFSIALFLDPAPHRINTHNQKPESRIQNPPTTLHRNLTLETPGRARRVTAFPSVKARVAAPSWRFECGWTRFHFLHPLDQSHASDETETHGPAKTFSKTIT